MRTVISVPTTWYVDNVNGSDANDGSTALLAFKTINYAIGYLCDGYDFAAQPTIKLVTTGVEYAEQVVLRRYVGSLGWNGWSAGGYPGIYTYPTIQGDPTNNAAVVVHAPTYSAFTGVKCLPWIIDSVLVKAPQWGVNSDAESHILLRNANFGACTLGHMASAYGGFIETLNGPYTVSGGGGYHVIGAKRGLYVSQGNAITFLGNPSFNYFAAGIAGSLVDAGGMSLAAGSGGCTSAHPGVVSNDGTSLMYPTSNGGWP